MKVSVEPYDESCPADENGDVCCPHTGLIYTFSQDDQSILFRRDDSDRLIAVLIQPAPWYDSILKSALFRAAADYLYHAEGISKLTAHNPMSSVTFELRPDEGDCVPIL